MKLALGAGIRVETIDGDAVVLDRGGNVVHHVSGDGAEVLDLVRRGADDADVPARLVPAMALLVDAGVVVSSDWSRRRLLKAAGAGVAGGALVSVALASPAAAASGTVSGVIMAKTVNNNENVPLSTICLTGAIGNSQRGIGTFTRTEGGTPTISVTMTLTTGTSAVGREVFILQSDSNPTCLGGTGSNVGVWAASPALGPQTFSAPIIAGATRFVLALQLSGGGGVDGWSTNVAVLP